MKKVSNKLRVLHFAQIPCEPFIIDVTDEENAFFTIETLAKQHLFLFNNNIIPDYSNVLLVEMFEEDSDEDGTPDWVDYYNEEEGMDWDEIVQQYLMIEA